MMSGEVCPEPEQQDVLNRDPVTNERVGYGDSCRWNRMQEGRVRCWKRGSKSGWRLSED